MISNFFKPVENTSDTPTAAKKRKITATTAVTSKETENHASHDLTDKEVPNGDLAKDAGKVCSETSETVAISEDQLKMIEAKRLAAAALRAQNALLKLEKENMADDWFKVFKPEMEKPYFLKIKKTLEEEAGRGVTIYPLPNQMYTFTKCPLSDIRVVIIGQDPYHGPNQAHGLCFSVKKPVKPPPSLINIYRELESDLGDKFTRPPHGFLEGWCTEGVLLLNASLSVRRGVPNSHKDIGWATFTDAIITYLNKNKKDLVFMLWGGFAQKKGKSIDKQKHLVLTAKHPSPLGANQGGWFGCKHFSKANEYLVSKGKKEVNWNHLP
ncbi:uracil-DNA glycosylase-like protein [Phlyctochytrium arcticum]|nr:uracil-DNA glycosylase-like protein [Phlyctochytrium arcticum]